MGSHRLVPRWLKAGVLFLGFAAAGAPASTGLPGLSDLFVRPACAADGSGGKAAAAETPQQRLGTALATMRKVTSYHAKADLIINKKNAHIDGDWGAGAVVFDLKRGDGQLTRNVIIENAGAWTSSDAGKTWQKHPQPQLLALQTMLVSGALSPSLKLAERGPIKIVGDEDIEGTMTTHIQIVDKSPVDVWVYADKALGKVVRKVHVTFAADDGDIDATVIYSALNKPVTIKPPM